MTEIRTMMREDLPGVTELERLCFSRPWSFTALEEELENPVSVFLVAREKEQIIGYVGMQTASGEGYVANLAVHPDFRRQGVGRVLMKALLQKAGERECAFLSLEVRVSNDAAIALYAGLGFKNMGIRPRFYETPTEDARIMTFFFDGQTF